MDIFGRDFDFDFYAVNSRTHPDGTSFRGTRVEVSLILEGTVRFVADGQAYEVQAPCATLQAYRSELEARARSPGLVRTMWCQFAADDLPVNDWAILGSLPRVQPIPRLLPSLFVGALAVGDGPHGAGAIGRQVRNSLGQAILAEYFRNALAHDGQRPLPRNVSIAKHMIDTDHSFPWTVGQLAKVAGTNPNYLIHLFTTHVGAPPIHYLWERRLDVGLNMLQTTDRPIEEIAFDCGFQSAAHFSRRVKERTGFSPGRLRRL